MTPEEFIRYLTGEDMQDFIARATAGGMTLRDYLIKYLADHPGQTPDASPTEQL